MIAQSANLNMSALPVDVPTAAAPGVISTGLLRAAPLAVVMAEERKEAEKVQAQPIATGVTQHIRKCWVEARTAKQMTVERRMLQNMRARRGEYDPEKLGAIQQMGGSEVFAGLTSVKCRAATAWLRDVMMATGSERPWTLKPTPVADLPPDINDKIVQAVAGPLAQMMQAGQQVTDDQLVQALSDARDEVYNAVQEEARKRSDRMSDKMEDQLIEGGFLRALDQFLEDITTFPCAILKGPVIRKRKELKWVPGKDGQYKVQVTDVLKEEWERVSPFDIFPSPAATTIQDGYLIEKHKLTREDLTALIGVDGYDEASIRVVLDEYGRGGLREWLTNDVAQAAAEGKSTIHIAQNVDGIIEALQFWGSVQGKMLIEWGLTDEDIPDPTKEYNVEAWLIGHYVIKAVLNYDPLGRKPYYKASYEDVPGSWWGNSVADLIRDTQVVANAALRGIVNNMGIASGPQVTVNVERLAPGEDVTTLTPWRIWQVTNDNTGAGQPPIGFYQPDSRIGELMTVFQAFTSLADEYSGLPKYITGEAGSAGRTASGLSMLMGNAGKAIKQVVANIDIGVMTPMLERLYDHNMQYSDDPELKGDVQIVARGAESLINKESAQLRRNEFLAATANPIDMQIVGVQGRAAVLRETAKNLDMDVDKVVPPMSQLKQKLAAMQIMQQGQQNQGTPPKPAPIGGGQTLMNGAPVTDNFSPTS
jgi:hypothetical protein